MESKITASDKKNYILKTKKDIEIFLDCKKLEKMKLSKQDEILVKFIKTQFKDDWITPLEKVLHQLLRKYNKK